MQKTFLIFLLTFGFLPVQAKFYDEGFVMAQVRTDFNDFQTGTVNHPITLDRCLFDFPQVTNSYACEGPSVYTQSNAYSANGGDFSDSYWVLHVNNESSFAQIDGVPYNSGPPGQSLEVIEPGSQGIMGFSAFKECDHCPQSANVALCNATCENFYRAHIVLSHNELNPNPVQAIPFLGINAVNHRGNNEPIVQLNANFEVENSISFDIKLYDYKAPENNSSAAFIYLYFTTQWQNPDTNVMMNRMLFVTLGHTPTVDVIPNNSIAPKPPSENLSINQAGVNLSWNWPIVESFFYPGADLAYMESEDILTYCGFEVNGFDLSYRNQGFNPDGSEAVEKSFIINVEALFKCASDHHLFDSPMPQNEVLDVNIVGWANEIGGGVDSRIWMAVSNMRTLYTFAPKGSLMQKSMFCPYCIYRSKAAPQKINKQEKRVNPNPDSISVLGVKLNFDFYDKIYQKLSSGSANAITNKEHKNEKNEN